MPIYSLSTIRTFVSLESQPGDEGKTANGNHQPILDMLLRYDDWLYDRDLTEKIIKRLNTVELRSDETSRKIAQIYRKIVNQKGAYHKFPSLEVCEVRIFEEYFDLRKDRYLLSKKVLQAESQFFLGELEHPKTNVLHSATRNSLETFIDYLWSGKIALPKNDIKAVIDLIVIGEKWKVKGLLMHTLEYVLDPINNFSPSALQEPATVHSHIQNMISDLRACEVTISWLKNVPYIKVSNSSNPDVWNILAKMHFTHLQLTKKTHFESLRAFIRDYPFVTHLYLEKSAEIGDAEIQQLRDLSTVQSPLTIKVGREIEEKFLSRLGVSCVGMNLGEIQAVAIRCFREDLSAVEVVQSLADSAILEFVRSINHQPRFSFKDDSHILFIKKSSCIKSERPLANGDFSKRKHVSVYSNSLVYRLGRGSDGAVYRIENLTRKKSLQSMQQKFATLKVYSKGKNKGIRRAIELYQRITGGQKQEGIATKLQGVSKGEKCFDAILGQFYDGDLQELFYQKQLDEGSLQGMGNNKQQLFGWFLSLLKGLCRIHNEGICHLDIKPSNSLFKEKINSAGKTRIEVFISDFDTLAALNTSWGVFTRNTPQYVREKNLSRRIQIVDEIEHSKADFEKKCLAQKELIELGQEADLTALALFFLELLTGQNAIAEESDPEGLYMLYSGDFGGRSRGFRYAVSDKLTVSGEAFIEELRQSPGKEMVDILIDMVTPSGPRMTANQVLERVECYVRSSPYSTLQRTLLLG